MSSISERAETTPLRDLLGTPGWYPLGILTALNFVDELDRAVVVVFAPNLRRYFDLSNAALGGIVGLQVTLIILAAVPLGYLGTRVDRVRILRVSAGTWAVCSAATAFAVRLPVFVLARIGSGLGKAAVEPVGRSVLSDVYPPRAWTRVFAVHNAANPAGGVIGPLLAGAIGFVVAGDGAWRWAFPILAVPSAVAQLGARRLRDAAPHAEHGATAADRDGSDALPLGRAVGRVLGIVTFKRQMVAIGILGFALVGQGTFVSVLYEDEFGIGEGGRGVLLALLAAASLVGVLVGGPLGERVFQHDPKDAVRMVAAGIGAYAVVSSIAGFLPSIGLVVVVQCVAIVAIQVAVQPLNSILSAMTPARLRSLTFALLGLFVALFGGVLGGVLVGALADAHGVRVGLASLAPFGIVGGLLMLRSAATIDADIERVGAEEREAQASAARRASGQTARALEVRNVDFAYGNVPILFDVSIDVDDGEVVALLGTNGAGKSTLLRAICGLGRPTRGTVRYFGDDITWLDAEHRVAKGLVQVPGGKSTFPSLTVLENLRTGGYPFRRDRRRLEAAVEEVFGYFPVLAERQDQAAGTLSGGEQQMVALGRAFIAAPRVLLIDELSLGLAPVIVEQLLGIVRAFSDRGTSLVLVEQSVNVALTVADRAYFMERGEVRFDGSAHGLLERDDLLRSVFLHGVSSSDLAGTR